MNMRNGLLNPRQEKALELYKDPAGDTFGNRKQSMIKAGFSAGYANNPLSHHLDWFTDNIVQRVSMIQKAEKNIEEALNYEVHRHSDMTKAELELYKIKQNASQFVAKTLARSKYGDDKDKSAPSFTVVIKKYGEDKELSAIDVSAEDIEGLTG